MAIVLGAGISGLAAARALQSLGQSCTVLERHPSVGGLTRTVEVGAFCFDYTGHFLHLSRFATPADVPFAGLKNSDWQGINRRSCCYVGDRLITAPIQYHLGELPDPMLKACVDSYNARPALPDAKPISFRDYIISGFGQYLADLFLIPQNEKTMATSLDRLSNQAVKRFFPAPDEDRVRAGMRGEAISGSEYNATFWYPKTGGIELLVQGLAAGVKDLRLQEETIAIDLAQHELRTGSGHTFTWDSLLSSIPLLDLCRIANDRELNDAANHLSHSSTISINIGIRGELAPELRDLHWIYLPDRSIPFYRVGFYSNISRGTCATGHSAMYVEVGEPGETIDQINLLDDLEPKVYESLQRLGWLKRDQVVCSVAHVIRCAYVHHTPERDRLMEQILTRLREYDIHPIGRYGRWDYTSMEDSIESGISAARELV